MEPASLFTLQPEMASHMQQLTDNVADVTSASSSNEDVHVQGDVNFANFGKTFNWNPQLDSDNVILRE